ncbi:MAG: methyltransferase domain-containing protein [Bacteroidota bacterium]|nr:methyltransferase domain-containing protein [Bacteroidota bacterium]
MPNKFTYRSGEKELLDEPDIPKKLLFKNLRELDILNRTTGGHAISLKGIRQLITDQEKIYHVVDIGCGSGDALKAMADWTRSNKYKVKLTGVDMNADAIDYLKIHCADYPEITGITADYQEYLNRNESIDIVHCSLFCHHLKNDELLRLFNYFRLNTQTGFIINDLHRQWLAYYSAWLFPRLLNGTKLAKNDGPISVLRGFKKVELVDLIDEADIRNYTIQKEWLFRFLIVGKSKNHDRPER